MSVGRLSLWAAPVLKAIDLKIRACGLRGSLGVRFKLHCCTLNAATATSAAADPAAPSQA